MNDPVRPSNQPLGADHPLLATPADVLVEQTRSLVLWVWTLRWWLLIAVLLGGLAGGLLAATVLRKQTATALINLVPDQLENPLGSFSRKSIRFFHAPISSFTADALVQATLERLDGKMPTPRYLQEVRTDLNMIDYGDDVYEVSFSNRDGERALAFLRAHIENYSRSACERSLASLRREVSRLENTMQTVSERMRMTEARVREFRTRFADGRPEFAKENIANLHILQRRVSELEGQLTDVAIERDRVTRHLADEKPTIPLATMTSGDSERLARLDRVRMDVTALRASGLRDQHPDVARLLAEEQALVGLDVGRQPTLSQTSVEQRPNERYLQLSQRLDQLGVSKEQLGRQIITAKRLANEAQQVLVGLPDLEQQFTELSRGHEADIATSWVCRTCSHGCT